MMRDSDERKHSRVLAECPGTRGCHLRQRRVRRGPALVLGSCEDCEFKLPGTLLDTDVWTRREADSGKMHSVLNYDK